MGDAARPLLLLQESNFIMLLYVLSIVLGGIIEAYVFNSIFRAFVDFAGDSF